MRIRVSVICLLLTAACGGAVQNDPVVAPTPVPVIQPGPPVVDQHAVQQGNSGSNFGQISLAAGFTPDPHVAQGVSGGQQEASSLGAGCQGYISGTPDHLLQLQTSFNMLRIMAASQRDTTLVVQTPQGSYLCNDDSDGHHPMVQAANLAQGTYRIWVGSYQAQDGAPYQLGLSELSAVTPSSLVQGNSNTNANANPVNPGESNFGVVQLASGFAPDPHVAQGVSGGAIRATNVGSSCRGWISATPDHILMAQTNFSTLKILARSNQDTTLVVSNDSGQVWCDDDGGEGTNPKVQASFPPGRYRIWVGSYRQGVTASYRLGFSELAGVNTFSLPAPN